MLLNAASCFCFSVLKWSWYLRGVIHLLNSLWCPGDVILSRWLRTYLVFQSDKSLALNRNFNQKDCLLCWDCPQRTQCYWPFLHRKFKFASFGWLGFLPFPCGSRLEMNFQVQSYIKNTNVSCEKPEAEWCLSPDAKVTAVFFSFIPADHRLLHLLLPFRELKLENSHTYRPSACSLH